MPQIRSISDLRNRANEISTLCHETAEPVFITKNGKSDLVVMSEAAYDQMQARLELYAKLEEAEMDARRGDRGTPHDRMMRELRRGL